MFKNTGKRMAVIIFSLIILLFPLFINFLRMVPPTRFTQDGDWLSYLSTYYGGLFGGVVAGGFTLVGVLYTIRGEANKSLESKKVIIEIICAEILVKIEEFKKSYQNQEDAINRFRNIESLTRQISATCDDFKKISIDKGIRVDILPPIMSLKSHVDYINDYLKEVIPRLESRVIKEEEFNSDDEVMSVLIELNKGFISNINNRIMPSLDSILEIEKNLIIHRQKSQRS
ncbi:hypothetical protein [Priestia megaterium]